MLEEPKGWRQLQQRAQREKDPKKLAQIIDQMNQLLTEHEHAAAKEEKLASVARANVPSNTRQRVDYVALTNLSSSKRNSRIRRFRVW
jgi:23S rRNA maturation mini-RNase III